MAAGSITVDLLMKTGSFESDTNRATKAAEKRFKELKQEASDMGTVIAGSFAAVTAAAAYLGKQAIDTMDQMGKLAQSAGQSVEQFSALAYAGDLAGVSNDQLASAMVKLSKNMVDAAEGSGDAAKGFDALGVSVKNADGSLKTSDQVLSEVAGKLAGYRDGAEKTALAVNIFGKAGADLIPLLNGGADGLQKMKDEAQRLGVVLDTESVKAAEEFNDNLSRMKATMDGLTLAIAKEALPTLTDLSTRVLANAQDFGILNGAFQALYEKMLGGVEPADVLERQNKKTAESIKGLRAEIELLTKRGASEDFQGGVLGQMRTQLAALEAQAKRTTQALVDQLNAAAGRTTFGRGVGFDDPRYQKPAAPVLPAAAPGGGRPGRAPAPPHGTTEKPFETSDRFSELDALTRESEILNEANMWAAKFSVQLKEIEQPFDTVIVQMSEMDRMALTVGSSLGNAMEDLIIGGADADDVFKNLLKSMAQMVLQIGVLEPLMAQLKQSMGGGGGVPPNPYAAGSGGGIFSGIDWGQLIGGALLGSIGGLFSGAFGGMRATGGPVDAGKAYVVGERRPELFVPRTSGMILPNVPGAGAGGDKITLINQTTGRVDRVTEQRISPTERALILQEAREMYAADAADPSSRFSRNLRTTNNVRRRF